MNRVRKLGTSTTTFGTFTYTADDKVKTITYGNGEVANYTYDSRSRPTRILVMAGGTTKRMDLNYTCDGAGNRLTMVQAGGTTTYTYGKYNRLTGSRSSAQNITHTYDANGNLATKNDSIYSWTYTYDYENGMTKVQRETTTVERMVYDGDGRRIEDEANTVTSI